MNLCFNNIWCYINSMAFLSFFTFLFNQNRCKQIASFSFACSIGKNAIYIYEGLDFGFIMSNIYWILFLSGLHNDLHFLLEKRPSLTAVVSETDILLTHQKSFSQSFYWKCFSWQDECVRQLNIHLPNDPLSTCRFCQKQVRVSIWHFNKISITSV